MNKWKNEHAQFMHTCSLDSELLLICIHVETSLYLKHLLSHSKDPDRTALQQIPTH